MLRSQVGLTQENLRERSCMRTATWCQGMLGERTLIAAVNPTGSTATQWALHGGLEAGNDERHCIERTGDVFEPQARGIWKQGVMF